MDKTNKVFLTIIVFCAIAVTGLCAYAIINHKEIKESDAKKFKIEFEDLNGKVSEVNSEEYLTVQIPEENPINYKTGQQILDVLKKDKAIVLFGYANDPYTRAIVEPLLEVVKEKKVQKIYYVDILNIRDSYEFNGSIKPKQTKKGTDAYYEILKFFGKNLEKYYIKDEEGNMYDTGVKRLNPATVIAVNDGSIVSMHTNTLESHINPYEKLNDDEKLKLKEEFKSLVESLDSEVCTSRSC